MNKILAIVGPNASGKSALAVDIALDFKGEVVSADSRQVYAGFNLCSGKISSMEMRGVPHHLLSFVGTDEKYNVHRFQSDCLDVIDTIIGKNRLPILVGGTGLYVDAITSGYSFCRAAPNERLRTELEARSCTELVAILRAEQPEAMEFLQVTNKRRLIRAIELVRAGLRYSATRNHSKRFNFKKIGVRWRRDEILRRIRIRLRHRLEEGMIDEVRAALDSGVSETFLFNLGLEYRYILKYLRGEYRSLVDMETELSVRIGQFAKRQMTWFNRDPDIHWIAGPPSYSIEVREFIKQFLESD